LHDGIEIRHKREPTVRRAHPQTACDDSHEHGKVPRGRLADRYIEGTPTVSSALKDWIRHRIPAIRRRDEKLQKQSEKLHAKNAKIRRLRNQLKTSQRHRAELRRKLATLEDSTSRSMPQNRTNSSLSPAEQRAIDEKPSFRRQILSLRTYTRAAIHED